MSSVKVVDDEADILIRLNEQTPFVRNLRQVDLESSDDREDKIVGRLSAN